MTFRKNVLLLCVLLMFFFTSAAFCQSGQAVRVQGFYANDSLKVKVYQAPIPSHPVRAGAVGIINKRDAELEAPVQPPVLPPDPDKCQWLRFYFSGTCWNWFIKKPGTYGGQILTGSIQSNGKVRIEFQRFNKLLCTDGSGERLDIFYAVSSPTCNISDLTWMSPDQLNNYCMNFNPPPLVPVPWALWQKVVVGKSAPAAEFKDDAIISIHLQNNGIWIEGNIVEQLPLDQ